MSDDEKGATPPEDGSQTSPEGSQTTPSEPTQPPAPTSGDPPANSLGEESVKNRVARAQKTALAKGGAVSTVVEEPRDDGTYAILTEGPFKPERDGKYLYLTVVSDSAELVVSPAAKAYVYDKRFDYQLPNAGIEQYEGPFPLDGNGKLIRDTRKSPPKRYAYRFRLRPAISGI